MEAPLVIRGTFVDKSFVLDGPLPDAEGPAELIVYAQSSKESRPSIYDVFGKAKRLRTAEDLDSQLEEERATRSGT